MAVPEVPDEGAVRDRPNPVKAEALFPVAGPCQDIPSSTYTLQADVSVCTAT